MDWEFWTRIALCFLAGWVFGLVLGVATISLVRLILP